MPMWEEEEEEEGQERQTIQAHCSSTQVATKGDGDHHEPGGAHGHGAWELGRLGSIFFNT
jgi:hypothetical protein